MSFDHKMNIDLYSQPTLSKSSTMGKKSRVKTQKSGSGASTVVSPKEMMNLISELLQSMFVLYLYTRPLSLS